MDNLLLTKSVEVFFSDCYGGEIWSFDIASFRLSDADDFEEKKPSIKKNKPKVPATKKKEDSDPGVSKSANKPSKQKGVKLLAKENKKITENKGNHSKEQTCR